MIQVFVYGTLRPSLYPRRKMMGTAAKIEANGWELVNIGGKFPAAVRSNSFQPRTPSGHCSQWIYGEVVTVDSLDEFDAYEGYTPDGRGLYNRRNTQVRVGGSRDSCVAIIYYMDEEKLKEISKHCTIRTIPSGNWADEVRSWL